MLKAKEREMECLLNKLSEKDELLRKYCGQIEELKKDIKNKCKKYQEVLKELKAVQNESGTLCESLYEGDPCNVDDLEGLLGAILKILEDERNSLTQKLQHAERQMITLMAEKKKYLKERDEIKSQIQALISENERLVTEITSQKKTDYEKEEMLKTIETLKSEKNELFEKISKLHDNIQELNHNFKETRWALTSEVADKHDQVQELKRCVGALEDQLRQADMQTLFKDDIIKELRKELKSSRKSERPGLYDVVNELKERKKENASNVNLSKSTDMNKKETATSCSIEYSSAASVNSKKSRNDDKNNTNEHEKLLSQIECLKASLKAKMDEIKCQEDFTRSLEKELAKAKTDLCVLEKLKKQDRQCKSGVPSCSEPDLNRHHATLICVINKIEVMLRDLAIKHSCDLSKCKSSIDKEVERIRLVKKDLEKSKSKIQLSNYSGNSLTETEGSGSSQVKCHPDSESANSNCNLVHLEDFEKLREKAITGAVNLEKMKEQVDIMKNLINKYILEFPCDKVLIEKCENKLENLRTEFDHVTYQLCLLLQKINNNNNKSNIGESYYSLSCDETVSCKDDERINSEDTICMDEINRLKSEYQNIQKQICNQENAAEKLKIKLMQLEDEIQQKRNQLMEHATQVSSKECEISRLRELIRMLSHRLREAQCEPANAPDGISGDNAADLSGLFCDLQDLWCLLEQSMTSLFEAPEKLREENEKLIEKLGCLEKCICNKEETLRQLQDTIKLRECQIEDLKNNLRISESQSSRLSQDVEEKCRLIANLQEAVRKCKQLEVESLRFECCGLECKLEKYEKEILLKDKKLEYLHNEITELTSKNLFLIEKLKIIDPKLKILYKTSHLFEQTVCDLQNELQNKECEIESLYSKIKELECELEAEFKKCEERAAEDSKCIEELSLTVKNFQNELYCAQEDYRMQMIESENKLKKEHEMRECELSNTIFNLKAEINSLQSQMENVSCQDHVCSGSSDRENTVKRADSRKETYEKQIMKLHKALECVSEEHQEEKKNILQKLCDEKKENFKKKNLLTKMSENMRQKMQSETTLKECVDHLKYEIESLKEENQQLKTETEARKKIMGALEKDNKINLTELEELICSLKMEKAELKTEFCNLKSEVEKEIKHRRLLECRVQDLNTVLQNKAEKFNQLVENYKCTCLRVQQTYETMKELEENLMCFQNNAGYNISNAKDTDCNCFKMLNIKTAENAKLLCHIQVLKVELESVQSENAAEQLNSEAFISRLQSDIECLENNLHESQVKCQKLSEENKKLLNELKCWNDKRTEMQNEFKERQKDLCEKLKTTVSEKNELLNSLDELQKQLEVICLENVNKEKINRELSEECTRLKTNKNPSDNHLSNKTDKIICNLSKELKNLHLELSEANENYNALNKEYQILLDQFKCSEKKKCNLEKLYAEVSNENQRLLDLNANYERELCEMKTQNSFLKDKLASKGDGCKASEEIKKLCEKVKELTLKIKSLEKKVIPQLEKEIADKTCYIENLKVELKEANINNQRMRSEALKVIEHTRKYLSAQRFANETLKTRLECSTKRGNLLGIENRELEEQLKAVTRMNEFLLCQLESGKRDFEEVEPRSFSPLPWGCSVVERDTSSSEYLAESGFQSMQPSPTTMDFDHESQYDSKRNCSQWNSLKKKKYGGSADFPPHRNDFR